MKDFKEKRKRKRAQRMIFSVPVLCVLVLLCVLMLVAVWNIYVKAQMTQENLDKITEVYNDLHSREMELIAGVEGLTTSFGVESEIRDKYGLVREGEEVTVIIDNKTKKEENSVEKEQGWWEWIKNIFR